MLFVEAFRNNRLDYLKQSQHLHSTLDGNFSLCSAQYIKKYPKCRQLEPPIMTYARDPTLFLFAQKTPSTNTTKTNNETPPTINMIQSQKSLTVPKSLARDDEKPVLPENTTTRWYHQVSRNVTGFTKSTSKGNSFSTSFSLPMQSTIEPDRPTTAPLVLEQTTRRPTSARMKSNTSNRPFNPPIVDLSNNFDRSTDLSVISTNPKPLEKKNPTVQRSYTDSHIRDNVPDSIVVHTLPSEIKEEIVDQSKTPRQNSQCKTNGFQHIVNLGSWQHRPKVHSDQPLPVDFDDDFNCTDKRFYEYKSPFSEEYDQAIALQAQLSMTNDNNEWNLRDFYRDVKTPLESGTNTRPVFEKCLKLSRLQANTVKWEQRRRQNLIAYNRLLKNSALDGNMINLPTNLADLKRELRCNECKRISCLGNCAPGQDYHQYKRVIPFSSLPTTTTTTTTTAREPMRTRFNLRTQRSMVELRPRSQQMIRAEPSSNGNPVLVVPLSDDESPTKRSSLSPANKKPISSGFLPGRSFRAQRRDPLTYFSSHKISSS